MGRTKESYCELYHAGDPKSTAPSPALGVGFSFGNEALADMQSDIAKGIWRQMVDETAALIEGSK